MQLRLSGKYVNILVTLLIENFKSEDKEYGIKEYLNDLRYSLELINDISLEIEKVDDSINLESKYREVFKNYGAAVLCVLIEEINFYSDNNIDTNTKIIYF